MNVNAHFQSDYLYYYYLLFCLLFFFFFLQNNMFKFTKLFRPSFIIIIVYFSPAICTRTYLIIR